MSSKKAPLVGLDIGSDAIKMVELVQRRSGVIAVERCAIQQLPEGALLDGAIVKVDEVAQAISACHTKLGSKSKSVAVALPFSAVVIKRLNIGADLSEDDAEEEVASQIGGMLPFDISEANVDFQLLPQAEDVESPDFQPALGVAVKREKIDEWLNVVETAGLRAEVVDCESLAYHTALQELLDRRDETIDNKNWALVAIGRQSMSFIVLRNGEVIYSRDASFGLANLAADLMMSFGVDEAVAAEIVDGTRDRPDGYDRMLENYAESAAQEIQRAFQLFVTSTSFTHLDGVFLHDEGAVVKTLPDLVSSQMQTQCSLFDPFDGLEIGPDVKSEGGEVFSRLVLACGLAFRRFDQ